MKIFLLFNNNIINSGTKFNWYIFKKTSNNVDKKVFEKMMKDADSNGDGAIEFEEFNSIMEKFFQ